MTARAFLHASGRRCSMGGAIAPPYTSTAAASKRSATWPRGPATERNAATPNSTGSALRRGSITAPWRAVRRPWTCRRSPRSPHAKRRGDHGCHGSLTRRSASPRSSQSPWRGAAERAIGRDEPADVAETDAAQLAQGPGDVDLGPGPGGGGDPDLSDATPDVLICTHSGRVVAVHPIDGLNMSRGRVDPLGKRLGEPLVLGVGQGAGHGCARSLWDPARELPDIAVYVKAQSERGIHFPNSTAVKFRNLKSFFPKHRKARSCASR